MTRGHLESARSIGDLGLGNWFFRVQPGIGSVQIAGEKLLVQNVFVLGISTNGGLANLSLFRGEDPGQRRYSSWFAQSVESRCSGCSNVCIVVVKVGQQRRDGLFVAQLAQRSDGRRADIQIGRASCRERV